MTPTGAHRVLLERGELLSWLTLSGTTDGQAAPAVVRFTAEDGVSVDLLDSPAGWPTTLERRGDLVLHGIAVDGGYPFTILDARVNQIALGGRVRRVRATTLGLGAHFDYNTSWSSASFGTAHLHEWTGETGLRITAWECDESGQLERFAHEWTPPQRHVVERPEARLTIGPMMETEAAFSAEQRIVTSTRLGVRPNEPLTVGQFERTFAQPLVAFCAFAADRPEALVYEAVSDAVRRERAVILRAGRKVEPRDWRPDDRFLFRAEQIGDISRVYGRWMDLWEESSVEIATFVDALSEGNTFSRARLLSGVAALEAYWRTRLKFDEQHRQRKGTSLIDKLKMLRHYADVTPELIGVTNKNLKLIAAARNLYAHLDQTAVGHSDEEIDDLLVENCRRAAALLQACLMRDLQIPSAEVEVMFGEHLRSWPLA